MHSARNIKLLGLTVALLLACSVALSQEPGKAVQTSKARTAATSQQAASPSERRTAPWQQIKIPPLHPFTPQQPRRVTLPNGLVLFLQEDHEIPLIEGTIRIRGGAREEPAEKTGLVGIYGRSWRTGGTKARTGDELDDFLEARAARVETGGGVDSTTLSWSCLKADFDDVLKIIVEVLREPAFREDKIALAKQRANTEIARRNDDPGGIAEREAVKLAYGPDNPYARTAEYATIAAIKRDDLVDWHSRYAHPNNSILGILGDFDASAMEQKLRAAFGAWPQGQKAVPPKIEFHPAPPAIYLAKKDDVNQSNVRMVHLGITRDNPDYYAVSVMNEIFGGGFSSRLVSHIRTRLGLAYSVGGGIGAGYDHPGIFRVVAGTKSEATARAIEALKKELDDLEKNPATPNELKRAKDTILNSFIFEFAEKDQVLAARMTYEFYGYPLDFLERFPAGIRKVTTDDVERVARKYVHKEKLATLVVGNPAELGEQLAKLGPVIPIDISIPEGTTVKPAANRPAGSSAEGKALAAKVAEFMGGEQKLRDIKAIRQSVSSLRKTDQGDLPIQVAQTVIYPDRASVLMQTPMGSMSMVITPKESFRAVGSDLQSMSSAEHAENSKSIRRDLIYVAQHSVDPKFSFATAGSERIGGTEVKILEVSGDDAETRWYVDPASGRVLRAVFKTLGPQGPTERTIDYSDWKKFGGIILPAKRVISENGQVVAEDEVKQIEINPPVDPKLFQRPSQANAGQNPR